MKNIKFLLGFIAGIFCSIVTVYATSTLSGENVVYNETTVQDALDSLYDKSTYGDAIDANILKDKTALIGGNKITGSMTNNGAITQTINPGGSFTIPEGYHDGSGTVTANANQNSGTYTYAANSTGETVDMGINNTYRYVNAENVYSKGLEDADARPNTDSENYKAGYDAGAASKTLKQVTIGSTSAIRQNVTFNVAKILPDNYKNLTVNNFKLVCSTKVEHRNWESSPLDISGYSSYIAGYNASTGVLTVYSGGLQSHTGVQTGHINSAFASTIYCLYV